MHLQKNRIRMKEMEIHTLAGMNEHNADALQGLMGSLRSLMFPGSPDADEESKKELEKRKEALAREAQKAFIIKPIDIKEVMKKASTNPEYGKLAGRALAEHERERKKQLERKVRAERDRATMRKRLENMKRRKR